MEESSAEENIRTKGVRSDRKSGENCIRRSFITYALLPV
jgi:hypothetical protein